MRAFRLCSGTLSEHQSILLPACQMSKKFKRDIPWGDMGLGQRPDSVIALDLSVSREYVTWHRNRLGVEAFNGVALDQSGTPVRSAYEAMYDAVLHWKHIPHDREVRVPGSPYIA